MCVDQIPDMHCSEKYASDTAQPTQPTKWSATYEGKPNFSKYPQLNIKQIKDGFEQGKWKACKSEILAPDSLHNNIATNKGEVHLKLRAKSESCGGCSAIQTTNCTMISKSTSESSLESAISCISFEEVKKRWRNKQIANQLVLGKDSGLIWNKFWRGWIFPKNRTLISRRSWSIMG